MTLILIGYITPDGKYEKQIRLAVSVLFVASILIPAIELIKGGGYSEAFFQTTLAIDRQAVAYSQEEIDQLYNRQLIDSYKADLERALKKRLETKCGFAGEVSVTIDEDLSSASFGEILSIGIKKAEDGPTSQQLKKVINGFYSVEDENIYITESEGNG
jgi:hypothetical protein